MDHRRSDDDTHAFDFDLTGDEARRQAEVLAALGEDWDPLAVIEGEHEAHRRLYEGLGPEQRAVRLRLVAAGVLPPMDAAELAAAYEQAGGDGRAAD